MVRFRLQRLISRSAEDVHVAGYELRREIGSGGFSVVYEAQDVAAGRLVALKVARDRSRGVRERFNLEAEIGRNLVSAQGVVGVLNHTRTDDGRSVLVLPYYDRGTAADLLADGKRPSLETVIGLVRQVAQGLDAMHRQHYLHRDVSPRNVLLSTEMGAAVGDLGCARGVNSVGSPPWTEALTPGYAAPEAEDADSVQIIASDVYTLAATAWALLTGRPPYGDPPAADAPGDEIARYLRRRRDRAPSTDPLLAAGVPTAVVEALHRALDPDPSRRPGRVLDLSDALTVATGRAVPVNNSVHEPTDDGGRTSVVGPLTPPSPSPVQGGQTQLHAPSQRRRGPGSGRRRTWTRAIVTVVGCFLLAFVIGRIASPPDGSAGADTTGEPTTAISAPQDLRIARTEGPLVYLTWTQADETGVAEVQLRGPGEDWRLAAREQVVAPAADPTGAGEAVVRLDDQLAGHCFRLAFVEGQTVAYSNDACVPTG